MSKYLDKHGRLHHKEVTAENPFPSNNGFIYSARAVRSGLFVNIDKKVLSICSQHNLRHLKEDVWPQVPQSRDEVLGLSYLGYTPEEITKTWKFNPEDRPIPPFSLSKLITQVKSLIVGFQPYYKRILGVNIKLYNIELAHRNFFWKNNLDQVYRLAFSVPMQDRYAILKWSNRFKLYRPDHLFYAALAMIDKRGEPNGIRYLKYGGKENLKASVSDYPEGHPVRIKVGM